MAAVSREVLLHAFALRRDYRTAEANAASRALLALEPGHPDLMRGMSPVPQASERLPEAIDWVRGAVFVSPNHPGLHYTQLITPRYR